MQHRVYQALPESDREILLLVQIQLVVPARLSSIIRVSSIKSSTESCSARKFRICSTDTSAAKFRFFNALRKVLRLLLNPCFTTWKKSFSLHGNFSLSLRFR